MILENLKEIPDSSVLGMTTFKRIGDCSEEQVINYIERLIGFVIIENLTVN